MPSAEDVIIRLRIYKGMSLESLIADTAHGDKFAFYELSTRILEFGGYENFDEAEQICLSWVGLSYEQLINIWKKQQPEEQ